MSQIQLKMVLFSESPDQQHTENDFQQVRTYKEIKTYF